MSKKNAFFLFAAKLLGSYAAWKLLYYLLEENDVPLWHSFKDAVAARIVASSAWMATHIFRLEGITYNSRNLLQEGKSGIFLADHCIGIAASVVFMLFIMVYKGRSKDKAWFIVLGVFLIFLINSMRIAALAYVQKFYSEKFFELAHTQVYLIITYGLIFLLIVWWVEMFADRADSDQPRSKEGQQAA